VKVQFVICNERALRAQRLRSARWGHVVRAGARLTRAAAPEPNSRRNRALAELCHASQLLFILAGHAQDHRGTTGAEAKKFWAIMPPSAAS